MCSILLMSISNVVSSVPIRGWNYWIIHLAIGRGRLLQRVLPITLIDLSIAYVNISLVCGLNPANLFSINIIISSFSGGNNPSAFCRYSYRFYK